jgi:hypothetical protein
MTALTRCGHSSRNRFRVQRWRFRILLWPFSMEVIMSKLTIAMAAAVLAGCASTSGWRALSVDGTSESTVNESVALIQQELPAFRREHFYIALGDIWIDGRAEARAAGTEYVASDYYAQLDGLRYHDVLALSPRAQQSRYLAPGNPINQGPRGPMRTDGSNRPIGDPPFHSHWLLVRSSEIG